MAPPRSLARTVAALAVAVVALGAGCSDDGSTTTAGSGLAMPSETTEVPETTDAPDGAKPTEAEGATTAPSTTTTVDPVVAAACEGLNGFFPRPMGVEPPEDDSVAVEAIERLAAEGPEPQRSQAQALVDLQALEDEGAISDTEDELFAVYQEGLIAAGELYAWSLDTCATDVVVWSCLEVSSRKRFTEVGEAIDGPGAETTTTTTEPGAARPEDVYSEGHSEGDPVEVRRTDDEVVVAWVDDAGHAVEALYVIDDSGWRSDGMEECDDGEDEDDFGTVGGPIGG